MNKHVFNTLLFFALAITITLWAFSKNTLYPASLYQYLGQISGLIAILLMSVSLFLSTRIIFVEKIFKGLDKVYESHKTIGSVAVILGLLHPILFVIQNFSGIDTLKIYFLPSVNNIPYTVGILAAYTIVFSMILMVYMTLPYNLWKYSHRLMGLGFTIAGIHSLIVGSDVRFYLPLTIWMSIFLTVGVISYIYMLVFYYYFGYRYTYTIQSVSRRGDVFDIYLTPTRKTMEFKPGQFCYVSFQNEVTGKELHPFSICSSPLEKTLRLSVKSLGDYTMRLNNLAVNEKAYVYGPHGGFTLENSVTKSHVFVAGGIGITPFIAILRHMIMTKNTDEVNIFYTCKNSYDAVFDTEIESLKSKLPNMNYYLWISSEKGRLNASHIARSVNTKDADIFLCGPKKMMEDMARSFKKMGPNEDAITYENFALL